MIDHRVMAIVFNLIIFSGTPVLLLFFPSLSAPVTATVMMITWLFLLFLVNISTPDVLDLDGATFPMFRVVFCAL
ncbi:uncharacterized protein EDB91DRAFT_1108968 [Suillus paluster]|uniref:uncharacterized protein n=1 Tax=Suillus paluster TaxID=48578 RepID=UPI001B8750B3|nr:uncharacterized protein EDB91DRAFT_1108968 [Suillus paluster]KAG1749667.1 hypothetical protein EDB91DRAFT_1108968 [Suillus paluster]